MAEVFAGFVMGYALALAVAPVGAFALLRANQHEGFARRFAPPGTNLVALSMVLHLVAVLLLTALGLILGMALAGIEDRRPAGGLGSPNLAYTLLVVALVAVLAIPAFVLPAIRRYVAMAALVAIVTFGWAMPWLATFG